MPVLPFGLRLSSGRVLEGGGVTFYLLRRPLLNLAAAVFQKRGSSLKFTAIVLNKNATQLPASPHLGRWTGIRTCRLITSLFLGLAGWTLEKYWFGFSTGAGTDPTLPKNASLVPVYTSLRAAKGGLQCNVNILQKNCVKHSSYCSYMFDVGVLLCGYLHRFKKKRYCPKKQCRKLTYRLCYLMQSFLVLQPPNRFVFVHFIFISFYFLPPCLCSDLRGVPCKDPPAQHDHGRLHVFVF